MSNDKRLKVLVSAFKFSPIKGSEFATGWDYVRAIAEHEEVWVITRDLEREQTEGYLREHPEIMPGLRVHFIPWTRMEFNFPMWELPHSVLYRRWQRQAYRLACRLDSQIDFDLIHQVNGTGFRDPGYLWKIPKPFVWGPVNGLQFFPLRLLNAVPARSRPFFVLKNLSTLWAMYLGRRPKCAAAAAREIIAASSTAAARVRALWGRQATILCEVSAADWKLSPPARRSPGEPLRIIWSGSFQPRKALNVLLLALERLKSSSADWRLTVIGAGALERRWKSLALGLGFGERCTFVGSVPRTEALSLMATGHCLAHTSLYDGTPNVVVEALAHGLPVICLDQFGCRDVVHAECGIKIQVRKFDQIVHDFAESIETLWGSEPRRYEMAIAAQKATVNLTWKYKASVLAELYRRMLAGNSGS